MAKLRAVVIGLGKIGQGYDYDNRDGSSVLSHAQAFRHHSSYELVGAYDPNAEARDKFQKKFELTAAADLNILLENAKADIIVVASPTEFHLAHIQAAIKYSPKIILCEKPLAYHLEEGTQIVEAAKSAGCLLAANYMRRFDPGVHLLKQRIQAGALGEIYKGVFQYSKGMYNNASHFVDLMHFLLGESSGVQVLQKGRRWNHLDPEPDFLVQFGAATIYFIAGREENYSLAQGELLGSHGKLCYSSGGEKIEIFSAVPDPRFTGYRDLSASPEKIESGLSRFQWHVVDNLAQYLDGRCPEIYSTGASALTTLTTIAKVATYG